MYFPILLIFYVSNKSLQAVISGGFSLGFIGFFILRLRGPYQALDGKHHQKNENGPPKFSRYHLSSLFFYFNKRIKQ